MPLELKNSIESGSPPVLRADAELQALFRLGAEPDAHRTSWPTPSVSRISNGESKTFVSIPAKDAALGVGAGRAERGLGEVVGTEEKNSTSSARGQAGATRSSQALQLSPVID
jgi:hypothetical protein